MWVVLQFACYTVKSETFETVYLWIKRRGTIESVQLPVHQYASVVGIRSKVFTNCPKYIQARSSTVEADDHLASHIWTMVVIPAPHLNLFTTNTRNSFIPEHSQSATYQCTSRKTLSDCTGRVTFATKTRTILKLDFKFVLSSPRSL